MISRYTAVDVIRWRQADERRLPMKLSQLNDDAFVGRRDFVLSGLHLLHEGLGYTHIALHEPDAARAHFFESCQYVLRLFLLPSSGEVVSSGRLQAGYFQSWLIALSIGADGLAFSLTDSFKNEYLTGKDSLAEVERIALALQLLILGRADGAKDILQARPIPAASDFTHYFDCLRAIAEREEDRFVESLDLAAKEWCSRIVKTHKGYPQAVCFMNGLGLLRLAERFVEHPIEIDNDLIPSQLFPTQRAA
jgi:hypothetical protein